MTLVSINGTGNMGQAIAHVVTAGGNAVETEQRLPSSAYRAERKSPWPA